MKKTPKMIACPHCDYHFWSDGSMIEPDPQADGDEIVKAQEDYESLAWYKDVHPSDLKKFRMKIARLIQAGIQKNEEGIEVVRKEVGGFQEFNAESFKHHIEAIETLERKVKSLNDSYETHFGLFHSLTTKPQPEEFEKNVPYGIAGGEFKPQTKGGVAYAWDKDKKKKHPLIPGVSVFSCSKYGQLLYHHSDQYYEQRDVLKHHGYPIVAGRIDPNLYWAHRYACTWLFDLDFPGGDK